MKTSLSAVVPLGPAHRVAGFACGERDIDQFPHERAAIEQKLRLSQVYVSTDLQGEVLAYFTLSPITVRVEPALLTTLGADSVPYPAIGGFLLGRLGVQRTLQHQGVGEALVMRAAQIAKAEAEVVGGVFLAVDPKTDRLLEWYAKQEFVRLGTRTRRMILPLRAVP